MSEERNETLNKRLKSEIDAADVLDNEQRFIVFDLIDKVLGGMNKCGPL